MAELSRSVTTIVKKYVAQVQAVAGGPVEVQETDAAGAKIRTLRTYSLDPNGNLVEA
jgi:hypothetical protein